MPVAFFSDGNQPRTHAESYERGVVGTAIIRDYDLSSDIVVTKCALRFFDADAQCVGFIQARHYYGDFNYG